MCFLLHFLIWKNSPVMGDSIAFRYIASTLLERMTGKVFWHKDCFIPMVRRNPRVNGLRLGSEYPIIYDRLVIYPRWWLDFLNQTVLELMDLRKNRLIQVWLMRAEDTSSPGWSSLVRSVHVCFALRGHRATWACVLPVCAFLYLSFGRILWCSCLLAGFGKWPT